MLPGEPRPLVTQRLVLRLIDGSDEAAIHTYRSDPSVTQYLSHNPLTSEANRERLTQLLALGAASNGTWFNYGWAITLRESGEVIGDARTWNSTALAATGVLAPGKHPAGGQRWPMSSIPITTNRVTAVRLRRCWSSGSSRTAESVPPSRQSTNQTVPPSGSSKALDSGGTPFSRQTRKRPAKASPC